MPDTLGRLLDPATGMGAYRLDAACRFTAVDAAAAAMLGVPEALLLGRAVWDAFPALRAALRPPFEAVLQGAGPRRFVFRLAPLERWYAVRVEPLGPAATPTGLAVGFADVTEGFGPVEEEIAAQRLAAAAAATGRLAHDVNNILTVMLGHAELLEEDLADRPALQDAARRIMAAADRGAALTGNVLRFARRRRAEPIETALPPLLERLAAALTAEAPAFPVVLRCEPGLPPVLAAEAEVEAALRELVANARAALGAGGTVRLAARAVPEAEEVLLSVADAGRGLPPRLRRHCVEPFVAGGAGAGLGLSAVHGFATAHGGRLALESAPGAGTTVLLSLPAGHPREEAPRLASGAPAQVMLVEDDPAGRAALTRLLGQLGYGVAAMGSAAEALEAMRCGPPPDLLLADVVLPGGPDGAELVEQARQLHPALPAVLISGFAARRVVPLEQDGVPLLPKPFRKAELRAVLRRTLDAARPGAGLPRP